MNPRIQAQLGSLLDQLVDGDISHEQMHELDELIGNDADARRYYILHVALLAEIERGLPHATAHRSAERHDRSILPRAKWTLAAAAGLGIAVLLMVLASIQRRGVPLHTGSPATGVQQTRPSPESAAVARLATAQRPRFAGRTSPIDKEFHAGSYVLEEGIICLRFRNDVQLELAAPARFEIVNELRVVLAQGRARAHVPERGRGFTLAVPDMDIEDLGTEFGVHVGDDRSTELHVFIGEVELHRFGKLPEQLQEGSATIWKDGERIAFTTIDNAAFPTRTQIGLMRWRDFSERSRNDPSAVVYYDFEPDSSDLRLLKNRAVSGIGSDGTIFGATWVTGRWPEKGALLFERAGDRVELDIPGQFDAFTLSAWIQVTRFDYPLQVIFNPVKRQPGTHHVWQVQRNGSLHAGVEEMFFGASPAGTITTGQWLHTAVVADRSSQSATYYVNGERVLSPRWSGDGPFAFGICLIGAGTPEQCGLRGRIDDLALFRRAFTKEEIAEISEAGNEFMAVPLGRMHWPLHGTD